MYTSLVLFALAAPAADDALTWMRDYPAARRLAAEKSKPLAVFLGAGRAGYDKVVQGGLNDRTRQLLQGSYIPVFVDTSSEAGRRLAEQFEMPGGQGIVLSNRGGELQAFRHEGELRNSDLDTRLQRYADSTRVVTTDTLTSGRTSFYGPGTGSYGPGIVDGYQQPGYGYPGFYGQPGDGSQNYGNSGTTGRRRGMRRR